MCDKVLEGPIGLQIQRLREAKGLTLEQLAVRSGTSAPTLHRYEGGWDRFEVQTLARIAMALDAGLAVRFVPQVSGKDDKPTAGRLVRLFDPLFWDAKLRSSDLSQYPAWVLSRVLMYGTLEQVRAARCYFGDEAIANAIRRREIDDRTRSYWDAVLAA